MKLLLRWRNRVKFYPSTHMGGLPILDPGTKRGEWSASRPGHFTPGERTRGAHWIGVCVVPRVGIDLCHSVSREILCFQWHAYFHYLTSSLPQIPVHSQINPSTPLHISVTPSLKLALSSAIFFIFLPAHPVCYHHHHHHHISFMELGHLLTRSGLTYPEVSSKVYHDSFCQLGSSISLPWLLSVRLASR